jgi:hypothetical protein
VALAEEVCLEGDGGEKYVTAIKDLQIPETSRGHITVDVDFRYSTGFQVYGSGLNNFPYGAGNAEEDVILTNIAINEALESDPPLYAGQPGQDAYFIGIEEESEGDAGFIAAYGSENLTDLYWDPCTRANDCFAGAAVLNAQTKFVYADLSYAAGGGCGETGSNPDPDPDPPTFTITPGITGAWLDPARIGEGYIIEVIGSSLDLEILTYYFTYDQSGNQMWILAQGPVNGDTATLTASVTSGPVFGADYDPADYVIEEWGTITMVFTSCKAGTATYNSTKGYGSGTTDLARLTSITGSSCP